MYTIIISRLVIQNIRKHFMNQENIRLVLQQIMNKKYKNIYWAFTS